MKACAKFLFALAIAAAMMLAFRALAFTVCIVGGDGLGSELQAGDRLLVNRWSYGLRTGSDGSLFRYGRLLRRPVGHGDIVVFDSPVDSLPGVFICRCTAIPGDTVRTDAGLEIVPGKVTCADGDFYWMESLDKPGTMDSRTFGFVPESSIIGRVCLTLYNHDDTQPFYKGYRKRQ